MTAERALGGDPARPSGDDPARPSGDDPARPSGDERKVLPDRSDEDTDIGWGELPESDDDERITRERPPHHGG